jgi:hypothetical protein
VEAHVGHPQRFPEAKIWLTCGGTLAAVAATTLLWLRGQQLAEALYPTVSVSDAMWPVTAAWFCATVIAGFSVPFMIGRSLRTGMVLSSLAAVIGLGAVALAGRWVDLSLYAGHMWFADPSRKWELALLWLLPAILLLAAAVMAFLDYRVVRGTGGSGGAPHDPRKPTAGNEALHWPGSTYAGIDAQSNARERY